MSKNMDRSIDLAVQHIHVIIRLFVISSVYVRFNTFDLIKVHQFPKTNKSWSILLHLMRYQICYADLGCNRCDVCLRNWFAGPVVVRTSRGF